MLLRQLFEVATEGSTNAGSIAAIPNPHVAIGNSSARKAYGNGANPHPPKAKQRLNRNGTAKNALDMDTNIFGGETIKR
jgi:hypothetical protein